MKNKRKKKSLSRRLKSVSAKWRKLDCAKSIQITSVKLS